MRSCGFVGESEIDFDTSQSITCSEHWVRSCIKPSLASMPYLMFCQGKLKSELLPPTSESLGLHLKSANYQGFVWRNSLVGMQELPSPEYHGWKIEDKALKPFLMNKDPAPRGILELTTCNCKRSECRSRCSCNINGLSCAEALLLHSGR